MHTAEKKNSRIRATALNTLQIEMSALSLLMEHAINDDFCAAIQHMLQSDGRIVVTGIGKSALIAQKIVATLNSTGSPALFLHAADAIHGDLGMVQANDTVLCLSKSGETPEIRILAPLAKNMASALIAMTANLDSSLAKLADYVFITPIDREADPNNLAPTASTIAQMALGDAMATALLTEKGFSAKDFAKFHPGGALGKQLYLRVADLYILHEKPQVRPKASLKEVIWEMSNKRLGLVAVTNEAGKIVGIITEGDLRRMLEKTPALDSVEASEIMSTQPKTILPDALAIDALSFMREYSISQLLVAEKDGTYLGVIHIHDLIREGLL